MMIRRYPLSVWHYFCHTLLPDIKSCFSSRRDNQLLTVTLMIGVCLRAYFLSQPMRFDEATTFLAFSNGTFWDVFSYAAPNNHVLHTIFVKITTLLLGAHPAIIRLPAFLFGILAIILTFCLCRRLQTNGLVAALIVSISPYMVLFSTNARGYTLLVCLSLVMAIIALQWARHPSQGGSYLLSLVASLGLLTMPTMLLPIAGIYLWSLCLAYAKCRDMRKFTLTYFIPSCILIVPLTLFLYLPVIMYSGVKSIIANEYVASQGMNVFLRGIRWHIESTIFQYIRDIPGILIAMFIALVCIGLLAGIRHKNNAILTLLCSLFAGSLIIFMLKHKIPFERTWIFFIPFVAIAADAGATYVFGRLNTIGRNISIYLYIAVSIFSILLLSNESILKYNDTGHFPGGPAAGKYLAEKIKAGDSIYIECCENYSLFFYLWYFGASSYTYNVPSQSGQNFYIVPKGKKVLDLTPSFVEILVDFDDVKIYKQ